MAEGEVRLVASRYRLLDRLGQGGMGVVWRAHDELLRRDVAVKELHVRLPSFGDHAELAARRVLREARAAARLRHPGVVAVHDVVVDGGHPLIVMELVDGRSLGQEIRAAGQLSEQRVAAIGLQVLRALEAAHRHGIVHRDVKPANILLDGDRVMLTDFGIAAMTGDTTLTDGRLVLGSPEYLAPERVNGRPATPSTDLWSLGVSLCAALRGVSPFQRGDTQATLAAVLTYEPPPIPHAPRLWPVLADLLRKDPADRLSAAAAAAALAAVAQPAEAVDGPTDQVAAAAPPVPGRGVRRRLTVSLGVLVLVVVVAMWLVIRSGGTMAADGTGDRPSTTSAPPGFRVHHGDGFTIAVPADWVKDSTEYDVYWSSGLDKRKTLLAHVESWDEGPGDARTMLTEFEQAEFSIGFISEYRRLGLAETAAPPGMTAAELEGTYHVSREEGDFHAHDLIRAVVTESGRTYLLTLAAQTGDPSSTEQLWQANQADLTTILESFRVTS